MSFAYIYDSLVTVGESLHQVVLDALMKAGADEGELITLYYGDSLTANEVQSSHQYLFTPILKTGI